MTNDFDARFKAYYTSVEAALPAYLPGEDTAQGTIARAMAYSLLGAGKRIRAVLTLAFCELCGGREQDAMPFACAVEMIHAYSLIHDDLPCMDDDDMRRGKPSSHIAFGEGMAVLAGDALLTHAFSTLMASPAAAEYRCRACAELSAAAGADGMVGGQVIDLEHEGQPMEKPLLDILHSLKTGAMIRVAARLGCIAAGADEDMISRADRYAAAVGLAFQIVDDILDETSTTEELGKPVGSDEENSKTTYLTLYGIEASHKIVDGLVDDAIDALRGTRLDDGFLAWLAQKLAVRTK